MGVDCTDDRFDIPFQLFTAFRFHYMYCVGWFIEIRKFREVALVLGLFIVPLLPFVAYYVTKLYDPSNAALANQILYSYRISHHANPLIWFDFLELVRSAILLLGLMLMYPAN